MPINNQAPKYAQTQLRTDNSKTTKKYGLTILEESYEDKEAMTTFFLMGPRKHKAAVGKNNMVLIVFRLPHKSGTLIKSLMPFKKKDLNLIRFTLFILVIILTILLSS